MAKSLVSKLKKLQKRIRKLEKALVALPSDTDDRPLMRIHREELGDKAVEVTVVADSYLNSELTMAKRVAKILGSSVVAEQSDGSAPERMPVKGIYAPAWRRLPLRHHGKRGASKKKIAVVREYLQSIGIKKAELSISGRSIRITATRNGIAKIVKNIRHVQKKMKSLGFSEVLLKPAS